MLALVTACCAPRRRRAAAGAEAFTFAVSLAGGGPRPAASAAERRAHRRVAARFRARPEGRLRALRRPGQGRSRNVIGIARRPGDCLEIVMAHTDCDPPAPGADDNASGVGALVALARRSRGPRRCDVWLVATGAEERGTPGWPTIWARSPSRAGCAPAGERRPLRALARRGRARPGVLAALAAARARAARGTRAAARRRGARTSPVRWVRDAATGNSDHRELALAGVPAPSSACPTSRAVTPPANAGPPRARRLSPRAARRLAAAAELELTVEAHGAPTTLPPGVAQEAQLARARDAPSAAISTAPPRASARAMRGGPTSIDRGRRCIIEAVGGRRAAALGESWTAAIAGPASRLRRKPG